MYIDFEKAYDSVQHWTLQNIMSHLKLPEKLIRIVMTSITKCQTEFETAYGMTDPVNLERSKTRRPT